MVPYTRREYEIDLHCGYSFPDIVVRYPRMIQAGLRVVCGFMSLAENEQLEIINQLNPPQCYVFISIRTNTTSDSNGRFSYET